MLRRPGYALLTVVVGLAAVSVIVAMAITPNVAQLRDQWRLDHTLERLTFLTDSELSIQRFNADLGGYPGTLSHLSTQITTADASLCGTTYGADAVDDWAGRYAGRLYLPAGTPMAAGMLQDTLEYDAAGDAMVLVLTNVREEQARQLDRRVDGVADGTAGRLRYGTADAEGLLTLRWRTTIAQC